MVCIFQRYFLFVASEGLTWLAGKSPWFNRKYIDSNDGFWEVAIFSFSGGKTSHNTCLLNRDSNGFLEYLHIDWVAWSMIAYTKQWGVDHRSIVMFAHRGREPRPAYENTLSSTLIVRLLGRDSLNGLFEFVKRTCHPVCTTVSNEPWLHPPIIEVELRWAQPISRPEACWHE